MPRRTTTAKRGARTVYTERRADIIVDAVTKARHITTACALAGIGQSTLYTWLRRADEVEHAINHGHPYDPDWEPYLAFRDRLLMARAHAEEFALDVIRSDMEGGRLIQETPIVNDNGEIQYDDDGRVLADRKWSQPNGRLALTFLARSSPDRWGEKSTLEVITPDGMPALTDDGGLPADPDVPTDGEGKPLADVLALATRLAITQRQRDDGYDDVNPEGPVDAELVEDPA